MRNLKSLAMKVKRRICLEAKQLLVCETPGYATLYKYVCTYQSDSDSHDIYTLSIYPLDFLPSICIDLCAWKECTGHSTLVLVCNNGKLHTKQVQQW